MKIVALGLRGVPNVMGGVETHCEQLYPRMRIVAPDIRITVIARALYVPEGRATFQGVDIRPIPAIKNIYLEAVTHTFVGLLYARFAERADVVHIHAIGPGLLIPLAKLLGLPVVFTHHGEDYNREKWNGLAKMALRLGEAQAVRFADRMISVSRPVARSLMERNPALTNRISMIPNGAAVGQWLEADGSAAADALRRLDLEPGGYVMTVARLVPEKGIHDLVDAASDLPDGMKLVIVGGAQMKSAYAEKLLARASERVIFIGELPRDDITPLYANTALFVLASYHEGMPIVALEALSSGARVLLSDIAPNKDLDLSADNYFPVGNVAALRAKLSAIEDVPRANADVILLKYDWNVIARETVELFRVVVGKDDFAGVGFNAADDGRA
ncbi:glycosyltransferase family 4 protein [Methylosinus sp. PW1]|uniref:glycosyltransferase family 4 protein n=1 Tax=Methylosinus sp. PW1 TaxID=107636 RepID=UPI000564D970|nr:glycosyltransferase family 4 protein [Methylosinus sp. PW1]